MEGELIDIVIQDVPFSWDFEMIFTSFGFGFTFGLICAAIRAVVASVKALI